MKPQDSLPSGLVFFAGRTSPRQRRRRIAFAVLLVVAALATIWPIYPLFSGIRPLILGLPLSFAWPVLWLLVVFAGLCWVYRGDLDEGSDRTDGEER